jgi:cyclin C
MTRRFKWPGKSRIKDAVKLNTEDPRNDRFVINDTLRSSLCLLHPPHLIAIASIYLALSLHPPEDQSDSTPAAAEEGPAARTRRHSTTDPSLSASTGSKNTPVTSIPISIGGKTDSVTFLASLNVELSLVLEIIQEMVSLYEVWNALEIFAAASPSQHAAHAKSSGSGKAKTTTPGADELVVTILGRMKESREKDVAQDNYTVAKRTKLK